MITIQTRPSNTDAAKFKQHLELHRTTEGWFRDEAAATWDALLCFQERKGIIGNMLEIGVWHGKSASLLVRHANPIAETCVLLDMQLAEKELRETILRVRPEIDDTIMLLSADSRRLHADSLLVDGFSSFRWIHIDGEHTSSAIISDLKAADALLDKGGIVCIDDFFNWLYPQVTDGVFTYIRDHPEQFALFLCGYNKAYLARPHHVRELLSFCKDGLNEELEARGVEATLGKTTHPAEMNTFGMGARWEGKALRGPDWDQDDIQI